MVTFYLVEELERENDFDRQTLVKYLSSDTVNFFTSLFGPLCTRGGEEYIYQLEARVREADGARRAFHLAPG